MKYGSSYKGCDLNDYLPFDGTISADHTLLLVDRNMGTPILMSRPKAIVHFAIITAHSVLAATLYFQLALADN